MNKVIVMLLVSLLFSCNTGANSTGEVESSTDMASKNKKYACEEMGITSENEISRRIELLKFHGFTPTQAKDIEQVMAVYRSVSQSIDRLGQRNNLYSKSTAVKYQSCMDQHSLECFQLLTQVENGASEKDLMALTTQPLLECMGQ